MTKTCTQCHQAKPLTEFFRNKGAPEGLRSNCKSCEMAKRKAYRQKPYYKAYRRAYENAYRQKPDYKVYQKAYQKAYRQKPEVKVHTNNRCRKYLQNKRKERNYEKLTRFINGIADQ